MGEYRFSYHCESCLAFLSAKMVSDEIWVRLEKKLINAVADIVSRCPFRSGFEDLTKRHDVNANFMVQWLLHAIVPRVFACLKVLDSRFAD